MIANYDSTQIIGGIQDQQSTIYAFLEQQYLPLIKGMLRNKGLSTHLLEDRSQEVYYQSLFEVWRLTRRKKQYRETGKFRAFFMKVAENVSANVHRKYNKHRTLLHSCSEQRGEEEGHFVLHPAFMRGLASEWALSTSDDLEARLMHQFMVEQYDAHLSLSLARPDTSALNETQVHQHQLIEKNFPKLNPTEQEVMQLYWREQLKVSEIASYLGKSESNVKLILYRAKHKLRKWVRG